MYKPNLAHKGQTSLKNVSKVIYCGTPNLTTSRNIIVLKVQYIYTGTEINRIELKEKSLIWLHTKHFSTITYLNLQNVQ